MLELPRPSDFDDSSALITSLFRSCTPTTGTKKDAAAAAAGGSVTPVDVESLL